MGKVCVGWQNRGSLVATPPQQAGAGGRWCQQHARCTAGKRLPVGSIPHSHLLDVRLRGLWDDAQKLVGVLLRHGPTPRRSTSVQSLRPHAGLTKCVGPGWRPSKLPQLIADLLLVQSECECPRVRRECRAEDVNYGTSNGGAPGARLVLDCIDARLHF